LSRTNRKLNERLRIVPCKNGGASDGSFVNAGIPPTQHFVFNDPGERANRVENPHRDPPAMWPVAANLRALQMSACGVDHRTLSNVSAALTTSAACKSRPARLLTLPSRNAGGRRNYAPRSEATEQKHARVSGLCRKRLLRVVDGMSASAPYIESREEFPSSPPRSPRQPDFAEHLGPRREFHRDSARLESRKSH